jgi:hypothetical protein
MPVCGDCALVQIGRARMVLGRDRLERGYRFRSQEVCPQMLLPLSMRLEAFARIFGVPERVVRCGICCEPTERRDVVA